MGGSTHLKEIKESCMEVSTISPGNTNEMGGKIQKMILCYYQDVRKQTQQSFYLALSAAALGTAFYIVAICLSGNKGDLSSASKLSLIAGGLIHVISALNFFLYGKAAKQFSAFHICLERTNRFLLANTLCDNISCLIKRDSTRQDLIEHIANAPMLTLIGINRPEKAVNAGRVKSSVSPEHNGREQVNGMLPVDHEHN